MIVNLSTEEMLRVWKLRRYFEPLRADCVVTRTDGLDLDSVQKMEMKEWYLKLLDEGDLSLLPVNDIAADVAIKHNPDGSGTIILPAECRRIIEVDIDSWRQPAALTHPGSAIAKLQASPMSRGGSEEPVVVVHQGYLRVYSPRGGKLKTLKCVMEPSDGSYSMDEKAFSLIPVIE